MYKEVGVKGAGVGWVVAKAKTKKQDNTMVEFRGAISIDRRVLTVGVISGPHCQI